MDVFGAVGQASLSDLLAFISIVISLFVLYWTVLRPGRLTCEAPRCLGYIVHPNGETVIGLTTFFTNSGARPVHVDYLDLKVTAIDQQRKEYIFYCMTEATIERYKADMKLNQETLMRPFTLQPASSSDKHLIFAPSTGAFPGFLPGTYDLTIRAAFIGKRGTRDLCTRGMVISHPLEPGTFNMEIALRALDTIRL